VRGAWPWLVGGAALAIANAWLISYDVNQWDESWTLQIVRRIAAGEALYGDVWLGVTPLSIYALWGVVGIVGEQILVVKGLSALLATGSALLIARIALQVGAKPFGAGVCVLVTLPLAPAFGLSLYTPLAVFFLLACESLVLTTFPRRALGWVAAAGFAAGLSFAAKQNVGGLALLAAVVALLLAEPSRSGVRRALMAASTFAAVAVATVLAMTATGGPRTALDALGLAKGSYLRLGAVPYHDVLRAGLKPLTKAGAWRDLAAGRDRDLLLTTPKAILPVATALLVTAAWIAWLRRPPGSRNLDPVLTTVTAFAAAGFVSAYPRYDPTHLAWAAGPLLVAFVAALVRVFPNPGRTVRIAVGGIAGAWAVFALLGPLGDWRSGDRVRVELPHFAGAWTSRDQRDRAAAAVRRLTEELPERRVFIAIGNASFYYLAAGLENPTRFDYPASTSIGKRESDEIVRGVTDGTVPAVCLPEPSASIDSRPLELERRLRQVLRPGPDVGLCRLWLRAPRSG